MLHNNVIKTLPDNHYNDNDIVHICKGLVSFFYWIKILPNSQEQLLQETHLDNYFQI